MPHQKGAMDGLCGVYSIINAMKIVRADFLNESKVLFESIIDHLTEKRNLNEIIKNGMTIGILYNIINDLIPRGIPRSRPFLNRDATLSEVWGEIQTHLEEPATGIGAVILALQGKHDHWTVVRKVVNDTLILEDSNGLFKLSRDKITLGPPQKTNRIHQIIPECIVFIG
jgi:hypothetical protein